MRPWTRTVVQCEYNCHHRSPDKRKIEQEIVNHLPMKGLSEARGHNQAVNVVDKLVKAVVEKFIAK